MKERYNVAPWNDGKDAVCKAEDGKYILYTDHLAEIREIVDTYDLLIDRCDKKNSELEDERDGYRNGQQQVQDLLAKQIDNSLKLAAENKRLAALNDMFPQEIARLEDRVSAEYEAERTDDRAKIEELKKENKRLRELVDGARVIVEVFQWSTPAQERWREEWLKKAAKAMKEASHEGR